MVTASERGMRLGKYEIGRTLGEGNFGKVKFARHVDSGHPYAVKILDRKRILDLKIDDQLKREIGTLKLLKHPNVVRLHEVIPAILDPNPKTRINVDGIKADDWFRKDYTPVIIPYDDDEDDTTFDDAIVEDKEPDEGDDCGKKIPTHINAFELIGMSSYLDLSGFFEKEDVSGRKIRFTSNYSPKDLFRKIEDIVTEMGFQVQRSHRKLKVMQQQRGSSSPKSSGSLSVAAEVFELGPSLYVVELRKSQGDSSLYRQLCSKLSGDLGACGSHHLMKPQALMPELNGFEGKMSVAAL
ncbi:uncharacterized protein A4U43_C07F11520 [Asparagus officinalis]|uniref:non-specific serine/threonine protein kinase n=1 Tax=Asparagus officinalis TaxID=4686 RepID=A0A5P1EGB7_ASPOF|nr:uncharacterized protein A4U43_C07F11520 [Asparagus officinalis]